MSGKGKTILVTGGAGFIGSHLCERLHAEGHRVISLDNYFTGSKENHVDGVEYREGHTKDIAVLISETPDIVYHLGEYSRVEVSFNDPELVWDMNVHGSFSVVEFCKQKKCKLVYAGSSTKFGDGGLGRDQSPYAWTKAMNTELVRNYGDWFGLEYAITYFYNVYGPGERTADSYGTVVATFLNDYKNSGVLKVTQPGTQRRNFTHVDDIVSGLLLIGDRGYGDEYGLGASESYSILELAHMFDCTIEMTPEKKGTRMDGKLDTNRARLELGWDAKQKLRDYIEKNKHG